MVTLNNTALFAALSHDTNCDLVDFFLLKKLKTNMLCQLFRVSL